MAVGGSVQTVHGRPRPCINCVHGRTRAMHMVRPCPEHGRVRSRYVAKQGRVRGPYPTVYVPYTWPCTGRVPSTRPCTAVYTAIFTTRVRTMYTAMHGPSMTRTRPCTRSCILYTAVFTDCVQYTARKRPCTADGHGRVYGPCTRPCTVYMHVFVACVDGRPRQQKLVGRLLRKSNNSSSGKRLVYVFGIAVTF